MVVSSSDGNRPTKDSNGYWMGLSDPNVVVEALNNNKITDLLDNYLFLPQTNYWVANPNNANNPNNAGNLYIFSDNGSAHVGDASRNNTFYVRCISDSDE
jgi:hypothetical protein